MAAARFSLLLSLLAVGCTGDIGATSDGAGPDGPDLRGRRADGEPPPPVDDSLVVEAECDDRSEDTSLSALRRLSTPEVMASLRALVPEAAVEANEVWLAALPTEVTRHSPGEFAADSTQARVDATVEAVMRIAETVAQDDAHLAAIGPACLRDAPDAGCVAGFVRDFAPRVLRRPLSDEEVAFYVESFEADEGITDERQRVEVLLATLLTSPEFTHHVPVVQDGRLDRYALAARLSFSVTGAGPDDALMSAAGAGELDSVEGRETHARRLLEGPAGRRFVRDLFERWLGMHGEASPEKAADAAGVGADGLYDELRTEALDFVEHVVFTGGSFETLMTSQLVFPKTERLAEIFGTERSDGPVETTGRRAGLLTRPAVLISDNPRSSPILRGLFIWDRFFCHTFTLPEDVNVDEIAEANLAAIEDPNQVTARERTEIATGSPECAACHDSINPPGFALAHFGALGEEWGDFEIVHAEDETLQVPLEGDANVSLALNGANVALDGAGAMADFIAGSEQGQLCAARQVFRSTHLRSAFDTDTCHLRDLFEAVQSGAPILDVLVMNAASETPRVTTER